jgi:cyclopropane-fatty-acyl-phospholipid synthase
MNNNLLRWLQKQIASKIPLPWKLQLWDGSCLFFGNGEPAFQLKVNNPTGLLALAKFDECQLCEAYMNGAIDIVGDMLQIVDLHRLMKDVNPWHRLWRHLLPLIFGQVKIDARAISQHYDLEPEFYLTFIDKTRCYSHALFEDENEPPEVAQRRKLDFVIQACQLQPGQHVLDVGGGWGTLTEHAGVRGIQVTSLTISQKSQEFLQQLIARLNLPCRVIKQNFLEYESDERYDAIAILGVMEHLPNYFAVIRKLQQLLKPGGRVYIDASAIREKYKAPSFITRYIYPGNHSFFCLHDFLAAAAKSLLEVKAVYNDRYSYFLTCKAWAENLDRAHAEISKRWGEQLYRKFRIFLWGSAHAFKSGGLDAYRVVLELPQ